MGQILSSNTVYAKAYLTEKGRSYLFDPTNSLTPRFVTINNANAQGLVDLFQPVSFSLSDPDMNYNILLGILLESGDIVNVTGKNIGFVNGTITNLESHLISFNGSVAGNVDSITLQPIQRFQNITLLTDANNNIAQVDLSVDYKILTTDELVNV